MPDTKRMISEVAAENGIRVEPGDPLFALVTMNRMVFEEAAQMYYDHNQQLIVEFKESMKKAVLLAARIGRLRRRSFRRGATK